MSKRFVLPMSTLPSRLPLTQTIVFGLLLDRFDVPGWAWGIYGTFFGILNIIVIALMVEETSKPLSGYGKEDQ